MTEDYEDCYEIADEEFATQRDLRKEITGLIRQAVAIALKISSGRTIEARYFLDNEVWTCLPPVSDPFKPKQYHKQLADRDGGWRCHYCHVPFTPRPNGTCEATVDHKIPTSRGGNSEADNLVLCCTSCNSRKSNRYTYEQYLALTAPLRARQDGDTHDPIL